MHSNSMRTICLAALMLVAVCAQPAWAAGGKLIFENSLGTGVKGAFCAGDPQSAGKQVFGPVAKESTLQVDSKQIPDDPDCSRFYVLLDDGTGWQFYFEPSLGGSQSMALNWETPSKQSEERYPLLLIQNSGEYYTSAAGLPLVALVQSLAFGMTASDWKSFAVPGYDNLKERDQFVLAFGSVSWSLTEKGFSYYDDMKNNKGEALVSSVEFSSPFTLQMLDSMIEEFKQVGGLPLLVQRGKIASAFDARGKELEPSATLVEGLDGEDAAWDAFKDKVAESLDQEGELRMVFGTEELRIELSVDSETGNGLLRLSRTQEASFG